MRDLSWHITMRLENDWIIARDVTERRIAAQVFLQQGRSVNLFAFDVPDTHAHAGVCCTREAAGAFARRVELSLGRRLALTHRFEPARIREFQNHGHRENGFHYILGNTPRHGVAVDPFREASNLPDLLGCRVIGQYTASTVRRLFPRLTRAELLSHFGISDLGPGTDTRLLGEAAAAAIAVPRLQGSTQLVIAARRAAIAVGMALQMTPNQMASQLGITGRRVRQLLALPIDAKLHKAIELQLGLRERAH